MTTTKPCRIGHVEYPDLQSALDALKGPDEVIYLRPGTVIAGGRFRAPKFFWTGMLYADPDIPGGEMPIVMHCFFDCGKPDGGK